MKRLAPVVILVAAAACGSGDSVDAGPGEATAGEIQSLADAEAMLATREDTNEDGPADKGE